MDYMQHRRDHINAGRPLKEKTRKWIKPISDKRRAKMEEQKKDENGQTDLQKWFDARREEMTGICQCGCGEPSEKFNDKTFRASICHILPQRLFPSVALHPLNFVERKWRATDTSSACHSNMDNRSMDLWPNMADWDEIKRKFQVLRGLLTEKECRSKFFQHLESLVDGNSGI